MQDFSVTLARILTNMPQYVLCSCYILLWPNFFLCSAVIIWVNLTLRNAIWLRIRNTEYKKLTLNILVYTVGVKIKSLVYTYVWVNRNIYWCWWNSYNYMLINILMRLCCIQSQRAEMKGKKMSLKIGVVTLCIAIRWVSKLFPFIPNASDKQFVFSVHWLRMLQMSKEPGK